jgi:hypothetical protein
MAGARGPEAGFDRTLLEIAEEKASALRRIGERLETLTAELADLQAALPPLGDPGRSAHLERMRERRQEARRWRWFLEVQREAIGLCAHDQLDTHYPIPSLPPA